MSFSKTILLLFWLAGPVFGQIAIEPPRDTPLIEIAPDKVPTEGISEKGRIALAILPEKWKTAATPNFYVHFRRATEARKVVREVEYNLAYVARQLGATPSQYSKKSHIYVFEDSSEWSTFVDKTAMPEWTASFAFHDELFLNVRDKTSGTFDSHILAHETTHAVISRIYGRHYWPLWLNEGFAEYMGSAAIAGRKNQSLKRFQGKLEVADMPLEELVHLEAYPEKLADVARLYQTGEKFVRFLMSKGTGLQFVGFADALVAGQTLEQAISASYHDAFPDFSKLQAEFTRYSGSKR